MEFLLRLVVGSPLRARWLFRDIPSLDDLPGRTGRLHLEIVSHCWRYGHLLAHQLSSLVRHPPEGVDVTMTVYHSTEDRPTVELLDYFGAMEVPGVRWSWRALDRSHLMRRAIGRNEAALATSADWIWFTDCDVIFHEGALTGAGEALQGRTHPLVHPARERRTPLLAPEDPMLLPWSPERGVLDLDPGPFMTHELDRATGPMQITHGDAARRLGYCDVLTVYQQPAESWQKATEDRAFRWLMGTRGTAVEIPGVYRIRHAHKGRYGSPGLAAGVRGGIRRLRSWFRERGSRNDPGTGNASLASRDP